MPIDLANRTGLMVVADHVTAATTPDVNLIFLLVTISALLSKAAAGKRNFFGAYK